MCIRSSIEVVAHNLVALRLKDTLKHIYEIRLHGEVLHLNHVAVRIMHAINHELVDIDVSDII